MSTNLSEEFVAICEQAAQEMDTGRLLKLTERINELLEQQLQAAQAPPKPSRKARAA